MTAFVFKRAKEAVTQYYRTHPNPTRIAILEAELEEVRQSRNDWRKRLLRSEEERTQILNDNAELQALRTENHQLRGKVELESCRERVETLEEEVDTLKHLVEEKERGLERLREAEREWATHMCIVCGGVAKYVKQEGGRTYSFCLEHGLADLPDADKERADKAERDRLRQLGGNPMCAVCGGTPVEPVRHEEFSYWFCSEHDYEDLLRKDWPRS